MTNNQKFRFAVSGNGIIAAVGSGDGQTLDAYAGDSFNLFNGRALVVLRTSRQAGQIKLQAVADGLATSQAVVGSRRVAGLSELR